MVGLEGVGDVDGVAALQFFFRLSTTLARDLAESASEWMLSMCVVD